MRRLKRIAIPLATGALLLLCTHPALAEDGWQQDGDGRWVYMQNDKKLAGQWLPWPDGTRRFVGSNGLMTVNTWVNAEGNRYYAGEDGVPYVNTWFSIDTVPSRPDIKSSTLWYYAGEDGAIFKNGMFSINGKQFYFYGGGNSPRKTFFALEDQRYYAGEDGAIENDGWFDVPTTNTAGVTAHNWYYARPDGSLLRNGWQEADGHICYFDAIGRSPRASWITLENDRFYVDQNGVKPQPGWFSITGVDGKGNEYTNWYYAASNGAVFKNGWLELDGTWYYCDNGGVSYRNRWFVDGDKNRYYLDADGKLQNDGWFSITAKNASSGVENVSWYYARDNGIVLKDGYREVEGKTYYFDANGLMYKERWMTDSAGRRSYLGKSGALYQGRWFGISGTDANDTEYTNWYYADEQGKVLKGGWHTIDGKEYYLDSSGKMATGWIDDNEYYCGEDGARLYGWQWLEIKDDWQGEDAVNEYAGQYGSYAYFYFTPNTGRVKRCASGTYKDISIDGKRFCFDTHGIMQVGWIRVSSASPAVAGFHYYAENGEGTRQKGERIDESWLKVTGPDLESTGTEEWFYFKADGTPVCAPKGSYLIKKVDGKRYLFNEYGNTEYGLRRINGDFYYFGASKDKQEGVSGRCRISDGESDQSVYYFNSEGAGLTGIHEGYFYYKGKLQTADPDMQYEVFDVPGEGKRLVNTAGKIMKSAKVKDKDGNQWKTSSSGEILTCGSDSIAEIIEPEPTED